MEIVAAIIFILIVVPLLQDQRERALAKKLEKMRDPDLISTVVDAEIEKSKNEKVVIKKFSQFRF